MAKIMLTGGSGMIGQALVEYLSSQGHTCLVMTRTPKKEGEFLLNYELNKIDKKALDGVEIIINLAGANVGAKRWSESYKKEMYDSRVKTTRLLVETLNETTNNVTTFISTSATGIYSNNQEAILDESGPMGGDYLAQLCQDWEMEAHKISSPQTRVIIFRIGIVMSVRGGFIAKMAAPIRWGFGSVLGTGKQHISWIHEADLTAAFGFIINNPNLHGIFNLVCPNPLNNREITNQLAKCLHRKIILPAVPAWVLRIIFGDFSVELLANKKIAPKRLLEAGFQFKHSDFDAIGREIAAST